jgi:hypothetical protein
MRNVLHSFVVHFQFCKAALGLDCPDCPFRALPLKTDASCLFHSCVTVPISRQLSHHEKCIHAPMLI